MTKTFKSREKQGFFRNIFQPKYKYFKAVDNLNLEIQTGECVAFLGPNGAGKTTTTKMLTGLIYPTSGTVEVLGYKPQDRDFKFLRRIGLVMGNKTGLNWDLTPEQSFELNAEIYDMDIDTYQSKLEDLYSVLFDRNEKFEKILRTQIRKLSLGERMKMELIGAVMHSPEVLFLDEPTIGLDITAKKNIRNFIKKVNTEGVTVILTSHDMDDIEQICNRVVVINNGKLAFDGSLESLQMNDSRKLEDIIEKIYLEGNTTN